MDIFDEELLNFWRSLNKYMLHVKYIYGRGCGYKPKWLSKDNGRY